MTTIEKLNVLRKHGGPARTIGLADDIIIEFAARDEKLVEAVDTAYLSYQELLAQSPEILQMDEQDQILAVQDGFVNFYPDDAVNPFVSLAGSGPWLITLKGAVLYDCGGYGMLGFSHAPGDILEAMNRPPRDGQYHDAKHQPKKTDRCAEKGNWTHERQSAVQPICMFEQRFGVRHHGGENFRHQCQDHDRPGR